MENRNVQSIVGIIILPMCWSMIQLWGMESLLKICLKQLHNFQTGANCPCLLFFGNVYGIIIIKVVIL